MSGSKESLNEPRVSRNASQESLASSSNLSHMTTSTASVARRATNAVDRVKPAWLQNRSKGEVKVVGSDAASTEEPHNGGAVLPCAGGVDESIDQGLALPKRLSGWLLNIIGTEQSPMSSPTNVDSRKTPSRRPSNPSLNSVSSTGSHPKAKQATGFLSSFSSSARARAAAATGAAVSSTGLERALRYINETGSDSEIWLLGVRHGPSQNTGQSVNDLGPEIHVQEASPQVNAAASPTAPQVQKAELQQQMATGSSSAKALHILEVDSAEGNSDRSGSSSAQRRTRENSVPHSATSSRSNESNPSTGTREYVSEPLATGPAILGKSIGQNLNDIGWQTEFLLDFSSKIWCTYRNHFTPISRDGSISIEAEDVGLNAPTTASPQTPGPITPVTVSKTAMSSSAQATSRGATYVSTRKNAEIPATISTLHAHTSPSLGAALGVSLAQVSASPGAPSLSEKMGIPNLWGRATAVAQATGLTGRSGLTTDAGWGCMLRTGQSLLANSLVQAHLGREWRRGPQPFPETQTSEATPERQRWLLERARYAKYVEILSWFLDEPSKLCPFGVHRMAREGKRLGKEVGEWFGPSTAAGAIRKLVNDFPQAGIGVSVATDGVVYLSDVKAAAATISSSQELSSSKRKGASRSGVAGWQRPVVVLVGVRLGLEGVHPMYYESIQRLFTFPQSMGIAGGRPSSSYYFVGFQEDTLLYLDPHSVRPAVAVNWPPNVNDRLNSESIQVDGLPQAIKSSDEWWAHAYSDVELSTFHCDRPRRMPIRSLDPSMLLGFLVQDEDSLSDLTARVKSLTKPIFSIQNEMPRWMRESSNDDKVGEEGVGDEFESETGDDPSLESFSESSQAEDFETRSSAHTRDGFDHEETLERQSPEMTASTRAADGAALSKSSDAPSDAVSSSSPHAKVGITDGRVRSAIASHPSSLAFPNLGVVNVNSVSQSGPNTTGTSHLRPKQQNHSPGRDTFTETREEHRLRQLSTASNVTARNSDTIARNVSASSTVTLKHPYSDVRGDLGTISDVCLLPTGKPSSAQRSSGSHAFNSVSGIPFPEVPFPSSASCEGDVCQSSQCSQTSKMGLDHEHRRQSNLRRDRQGLVQTEEKSWADATVTTSHSNPARESSIPLSDKKAQIITADSTTPGSSSTTKSNSRSELTGAKPDQQVVTARHPTSPGQAECAGVSFSTSWEEVSYASVATSSPSLASGPSSTTRSTGARSEEWSQSPEDDELELLGQPHREEFAAWAKDSAQHAFADGDVHTVDVNGRMAPANGLDDEGWSLTFGPADA